MHLLTASETRAVEAAAVAETGLDLARLMEEAGRQVAMAVGQRVPDGSVVVVAGAGNNGGDGWVAARFLHEQGRAVSVLSVVEPQALSGIAADAVRQALAAGVPWNHVPDAPSAVPGSPAVVIDALLGTGSTLPLREPVAAWVMAISHTPAYVVAVDLPTGVDADTGAVPGPAVHADCTVTMIAPKRGLFVFPGAAHAGEIVVADLGIELKPSDVSGAPEIWPAEKYADLLPIPAADVHKNERGRVLLVAGSGRFPGAAVLAARGAMRAGAGYVTLCVPEAVVTVAQTHLMAAPVVGLPQTRAHALSSSAAAVVLDLARDYDAVVIGPGLTLADGAVAAVRSIVSRLDRPLVIDADGLNALVDAEALLANRVAPTVVTPHPGEMARLLGVTTADVQAGRISSALKLSEVAGTVVLKGAGTVISSEGRVVVNTSGTPALASAGTGDVLSGVIGALLASGMAPFEAAALGVYLHGRAGEAAASELTMMCVTAEDVPEYLPVAVAELVETW